MIKKIKYPFFVVTCIFMLTATGCSLRSTKNMEIQTETDYITNSISGTSDDTNDSQYESSQENETYEVGSAAKNNSVNGTESIEPAKTREVSIYTINEDTQGVESVTALVPEKSKITPELIVSLVQDSLADRMIDVGIDKVTTEKDTVIVSFLSNQPPLVNVGSGVEVSILNAFAQSLVDNLTEYPKVIFRVEGKAYSSGHNIFGLDEVYLDNSKTK